MPTIRHGSVATLGLAARRPSHRGRAPVLAPATFFAGRPAAPVPACARQSPATGVRNSAVRLTAPSSRHSPTSCLPSEWPVYSASVDTMPGTSADRPRYTWVLTALGLAAAVAVVASGVVVTHPRIEAEDLARHGELERVRSVPGHNCHCVHWQNPSV